MTDLCQAAVAMPWRINNLTEFKSGSNSMDGNSDEGLDAKFVEKGYSAENGPFGSDALDQDPLKDWEHVGSDLGDNLLDQFDLSEFLKDAVPIPGREASALEATQVPRGPVLNDDNFSQMLVHAFASHAKPMQLKMP